MLQYRNGERSDPFLFIYSDAGWLREYDPARPFPFWVNLEAANLCNLDCIFCSRQLSTGAKGFMDLDLLEKIVAEVRDRDKAAIRVAGWGEPLLHPRFADFVRIVKQAGVKMKLYTNGLLLTERLMEAFIDYGLDEIQFSMQGLNGDQYEFNRRKALFSDFEAKVRLAAHVREKRGTDRPFLSLLTSALKSELESASPRAFIDHWTPLVDKVAVDLTNLNFVRGLPRIQSLLADQALAMVHRACVDVFLAIEVKYDGTIEFCGQDADRHPGHTIGNIRHMTIQEAWRSPKMETHRQAVGRDLRHDEFPICKNCYPNTNKYDLFKDKYGPAPSDH
jgi:MoaA/NifB/PqqE/SkfB family radical SAM enzyme